MNESHSGGNGKKWRIAMVHDDGDEVMESLYYVHGSSG